MLSAGAGGCVSAPLRGTAPADAAAGEVRFELAGPGGAAIIVPVRINGEGPFNFVLDTGATLTCVDQELAKRLNLPARPGQIGMGAGINSRGQLQLVGISSLEVGTAKGQDLAAGALDLGNLRSIGLDVDGLIGLNFLKSYLVTLDFERKVLRLQTPQGDPQPEGP